MLKYKLGREGAEVQVGYGRCWSTGWMVKVLKDRLSGEDVEVQVGGRECAEVQVG